MAEINQEKIWSLRQFYKMAPGGVPIWKLKEHITKIGEVKTDEIHYHAYMCPISKVREVLDLPALPFEHFIIPGSFVAGGAVLSWLMRKDFNSDVDFFFKSEADREFFVGTFVNLLEPSEIEGPNSKFYKFGPTIINIVHKAFYDHVPECICSFDLTPCMVAVDGENFYWNNYSMSSICGMHVNLGHINNPVSTMRRITKYGERGFKASNWVLASVMDAYVKQPAEDRKKYWEHESDINVMARLLDEKDPIHKQRASYGTSHHTGQVVQVKKSV